MWNASKMSTLVFNLFLSGAKRLSMTLPCIRTAGNYLGLGDKVCLHSLLGLWLGIVDSAFVHCDNAFKILIAFNFMASEQCLGTHLADTLWCCRILIHTPRAMANVQFSHFINRDTAVSVYKPFNFCIEWIRRSVSPAAWCIGEIWLYALKVLVLPLHLSKWHGCLHTASASCYEYPRAFRLLHPKSGFQSEAPWPSWECCDHATFSSRTLGGHAQLAPITPRSEMKWFSS